MKLRLTAAALIVCVFLSACGNAASIEAQSESSPSPAFTAAPVTAVEKESEEKGIADPRDLTIDPPYDFDVDTMEPFDFGDFFVQEYDCEKSSYKLLEGSDFETEVTVIKGKEAGPSVYVIAGIHGDEEAAWQTGKLLKKATIKAGTLYVIAPANRWGAEKLPKSRYIDGKDPNRVWPGNPSGNSAEQVAYSIFKDVEAKKPDFVFDLHEARLVEDDRDYLGSSLIFSDLSLMEEMFMDLLFATQSGEICSMPFDYYGPGPDGSINRTITEQLNIPVITVETFRGYEMEDRISDQLDIIQYVLRYYGMV